MSLSGKIKPSRERVGILGGTFDPPHVGHLILAAEATNALHLDRVLWVLTPDPPHKRGFQLAPWEIRLEMLQAAIQDTTVFQLSRVDLDRPAPHYAVDTLRLLHREERGAELVYLMGGDSLCDLPAWHQPESFVSQCDQIGVMRRPERDCDLAGLNARIPGLAQKVTFLAAPYLEISSTHIRDLVRQGGLYRYYLTQPVFDLIEHYQLYR